MFGAPRRWWILAVCNSGGGESCEARRTRGGKMRAGAGDVGSRGSGPSSRDGARFADRSWGGNGSQRTRYKTRDTRDHGIASLGSYTLVNAGLTGFWAGSRRGFRSWTRSRWGTTSGSG